MTITPTLARALDYPYPSPGRDFVLSDGVVHEFDAGIRLADRTPVLAVGSNQAPEQLRRKFGDNAVVPVTVAQLADHDVVYSAHMASYGSIPATLAPSPGTLVTVSLTWLTNDQLRRMHETEAVGVNYDYGVAETLAIELGGRPRVPIGCYVGRRGVFALDGAVIALAEINATGRSHEERRQADMLKLVHSRFSDGQDFDTWLGAMIEDHEARQALTETLASQSISIHLAAFQCLNPASMP
ncbi:MAG: hypothetical protein OSB69_02405 [Alphaproteobacteria bacterium]|nr:hypothetical protein [Alphaproteobacteria bacterium]